MGFLLLAEEAAVLPLAEELLVVEAYPEVVVRLAE
jgi:hypothetical protein